MSDKLIIKDSNFIKGWEKLLVETEKDSKLKETFLKSPASVLSELLFDKPDKLSTDEIDKSNLILFSVMSNKDFMNWAKEYEKTVIKKVKNPNELSSDELSEIYKEASEALINYADKDLLRAIFRISPEEIKKMIRDDPKLRQVGPVEEKASAVVLIILVVVVLAIVWVSGTSSPLGSAKILSHGSLQNLSRQLVSQLEKQAVQVRNKNFAIPMHKDLKDIVNKELKGVTIKDLKGVSRINIRDLKGRDRKK